MFKKTILSLSFMAVATVASAAKVEDLSIKPTAGAQAQGVARSVNMKSDNLKTLSQFKDKAGNLHIRSKQMHKGLPIWNFQVIAHQPQGGAGETTYSGFYVSQLDTDLAKTAVRIKPESEVLAFVREHHVSMGPEASVVEDGRTKSYIYLDQDKIAHQVYEVSFAANAPEGNHPSLPTYIVDAQNLVIYKHWDAMMHQKVGRGPGGNFNTGRYMYGRGKDFKPFAIKVRGNVCIMKSTYVSTYDLANDIMGYEPYRYSCHAGKKKYYHEEAVINGAYGVLNDAHAFGLTIINMYHDWYGINPLPVPLIMQVHYALDYANAMWDPRNLVMSFGDGDEKMYPLVAMDVAAHEVAHGITQFSSDLLYMGQSGGLNESFSDMASQAGTYYLYGRNNWQIGSTIMKSGLPLRYMDDPRKDGASIAHTSDYVEGLDVHFSSGVFNKAFYNLATTPGWDVMRAYTVFYYANLTEWMPLETFASAGCGTIRAAEALKSYDPAIEPSAVIKALEKVGVYYNYNTESCHT